MSTPMLARSLAPEDIAPGMFIAVLRILIEDTCFSFCPSDVHAGEIGPARYTVLPCKGAGAPVRIEEVCLPFVIGRRASGKQVAFDVRRYDIAQVSEAYGSAYFRNARIERRTAARDRDTESKRGRKRRR